MAKANRRAPFGSAGRKAYQRAAYAASQGGGGGPTLGALILNGSLTQGVAASGVTITGATAGSTITLGIAGLTVSGSGATRTVSGTPTASGNLNASEALAGATNTPRATYLGAVAAAPIALPAFTTAKYDGDSRTANAGQRAVSTALTVSAGNAGQTAAAYLQAVSGNKWLLGEGYSHAVGSTSTEAMVERSKTTSIANSGNPAFNHTAATADANFSIQSDGLTTVLTQPGSHVISASVSVNDAGTEGNSYYNTPKLASVTLPTIAAYADAIGAAGKIWITGCEFPRGDALYSMEPRTVSGGTCTAANPLNFVDGESFGAVGVVGNFGSGVPRVLTKVSSAPGQDQYTVSASGVYVFGGTAPTTVNISYNSSGTSRKATSDFLRIVNEWMNSSAANFTSAINGNNYNMPGLLFNRPWVRIADTFNALLDTASGATQLSKPGTLDNLQLHQNHVGDLLAAKAFKAKIDADYPSATSLDTRPTRNNWLAAQSSGVGGVTAFSGTLPPSMRTAFTTTAAPTLVSINGVAIGKVDTATGAITGTNVASGSLNFATGVWTLTMSVAPAAQAVIWFEQDIGNYDLTAMAEGTVGRNLVMNGLMDMTPAVGTNITTTTGTSSITGVADSAVPYGYTLTDTATVNALAAGTMTVAIAAETDAQGYPRFVIEATGVHTSAINISLGQILRNYTAKITAGDRILAGFRRRYQKHSTVGRLFGCGGGKLGVLMNATGGVSRNSRTGVQNPTSVGSQIDDFTPTAGNLYQIDDLLLAANDNAPLDHYFVAPLFDTTGVTFGSSQPIASARANANIPFAFRTGFGRLQVRRRNDVA